MEAIARVGRRETLLGRVSELLALDPGCEETYERVAVLGLGVLCEAAIVDAVEGGACVRRIALAHVSPELTPELGLRRGDTWPLGQAPGAVASAIERRVSVHLAELSSESVRLIAGADRGAPPLAADLVRMGARSALVLPMIVRGAAVGVLTLVRCGAAPAWGNQDRALAEELASRAAIAIANACEFSDLKQAARTRDEVLAVVSHDLRNPLHTISLAAELLLHTPAEPAAWRQHLKTICRVAASMNGMIDDLLDVTRIGTGEFRLRARATAVEPLMRLAIANLRYAASERGIQLQGMTIADVPSVQADPERVLQVLTNLVQNAVKFTPRDGSIRIEAGRRGDEVCFAVRDNGCGIAAAELPHVFERYWQSASNGRHGAGLGLAIAKGIVDAHHGRIWCDSSVGNGTSFYFTLPIAGDQDGRQVQAA